MARFDRQAERLKPLIYGNADRIERDVALTYSLPDGFLCRTQVQHLKAQAIYVTDQLGKQLWI
ncbi:hypothetical protein [Pseudoxanthomonas mexicana]